MNNFIGIPGILLCAVALVCIGCAVWYSFRLRRTMKRLERMLDDAMSDHFEESHYDETRLSRMESRLRRFLTASSLSRKNIEVDRARIKELVGDISHQTKTPIANILLYSQLLQEHNFPPEAALLVAQITAQSEKLRFLIQSLIKTSRLESGIVQVRPEENAVVTLIKKAVKEYRSKAEEKEIFLEVPGVYDIDAIAVFDPKWTGEALGNLLDNAIKYTIPGGAVSVSACSYELFCRIDVTDSGIGIAEEEHTKIFERFYRGVSVKNAEGVGVGLYLARQIVSEQGGYIKVKSKPNEGSTFSMFLPKV